MSGSYYVLGMVVTLARAGGYAFAKSSSLTGGASANFFMYLDDAQQARLDAEKTAGFSFDAQMDTAAARTCFALGTWVAARVHKTERGWRASAWGPVPGAVWSCHWIDGNRLRRRFTHGRFTDSSTADTPAIISDVRITPGSLRLKLDGSPIETVYPLANSSASYTTVSGERHLSISSPDFDGMLLLTKLI